MVEREKEREVLGLQSQKSSSSFELRGEKRLKFAGGIGRDLVALGCIFYRRAWPILGSNLLTRHTEGLDVIVNYNLLTRNCSLA